MEWIILILLVVIFWIIIYLSNAVFLIQKKLDQIQEKFDGPSWEGENDKSELHEDELCEAAKKAVIEAQTCSASFLQRKLNIGYARAANLVDLLEKNGVVSQGDGTRPCKVLKR